MKPCTSCGERDGHKPGCALLFKAGSLGPLFDPSTAAVEGHTLKQEALAQLEERHPDTISAIRWAMRRLFLERQRTVDPHLVWVSADDVREFLDATAQPQREDTHYVGAIFHEKGWVAVGMMASKRTANHARFVRQWAWRPEAIG